MVNQRREAVSYRPFRVAPVLSEGLLGVARDDGEFERKAAAGFARMAEQFGQKADRDAERRMTAAGEAKSAELKVSPTVVDGGQSVSPKEANERAAQARQYLMEKHGLNAAQASAFAGHGMQESGFNTTAVGDKGTAFGIMQWRGDRRAALNSFAQSNGRDVNDLYTQLDFAMQELRGTERRAGEKLFAARDVRSAVTALMDYERPAGWAPDRPTAGHGFDNRLAFALGFDPADAQSARKPMSVSSVAGEKPQLTGRDTIGGRAYDAALMKGYKQKLELAMLQDQDAVYEAYKDDPAMLEKAMGELLEAHRRDHLMPEIEAEYTIGFERRAYAKVREARQEQERRIQAEDRMAFIGRVEEMENAKSRALAGLDPNSDTAEAELASLQGTIDDHYDTAVARGVLTPAEAEKAKQDSRSDMLTGFYTKQAATMTADQIRSMRSEMERDYADGKLEGVTREVWARIQNGLISEEKASQARDQLASKALRQRGNELAERKARGLPVSADELARFQLDIGTAPDGREIAASTFMKIRVSEAIRAQPIEKVEQNLWSLMSADGLAPSPEDYDYAVKTVNAHKAEVLRDPLGVAERFGIVPAQPALPDPATATADELASALTARMINADIAAEHFGVPPKIFRPEEEAVLKNAIVSNDVQRHQGAMQQLDVLAAKTGLLDVERQFGKDAADRLQDWQARVRYASPEEAKQWLKDRNDPQWQERVKPLVAKGQTEARKTSVDDVVAMLDPNWVFDANAPIDRDTQRAMMNDFVALTGERFAVTGDAGTAKEQAIERMKKVWGTTSVFGGRGGRLMLYPPEQHYPTVAGSTGWIAEELGSVASERGLDVANMALVSDGKTKAAIERGEPPGYLMSSVNPETGLEELVADEQGRPLRHFFDPEAARKKALAQAEEARRTRNDPWIVFGRDSAVGPLYLGGADPADLADRQKRIGEIVDERDERMQEKRDIRDKLRAADIPGLPIPPEQR
ncbi:MAG: phage tail tip lysozyme [Allorhizobium sp.]